MPKDSKGPAAGVTLRLTEDPVTFTEHDDYKLYAKLD